MTTCELAPRNGTQTSAGRTPTVTVTPAADVFETADGFVVKADLPGVAPDAVDVRFEAGELSIEGRRPAAAANRPTAVYRRSFRVTDHVAADRIAAELKHGVLTLTLPKADAVKPRKIAVAVGN